MILLKNGHYLSPTGVFEKGDILINGEKISDIRTNIEENTNYEVINIQGLRLIPGFIDIHIHGAVGHDVMSASPKEINKIAKHLAAEGTTSFFPTTITADVNEVTNAIKNINEASQLKECGASIDGIHIEGPYISPRQKGCHDTTKMRLPDIGEYELFKYYAGNIKLHFTIAPELQKSIDFIDYVIKDNNTISIGHSDASFDETMEAVRHRAGIFTHLFNGMRGLHHREPGVAGTALISDAYVELICDGVHVHRENVKLVHKTKGKDKIVLVTDAMQAKGLGDGRYQFGGFDVIVSGGVARKEDGTLASSTLSIYQAVKNIMNFTGISLAEAVQMASINPAKAVGIDHITGSIEIGKRADILAVNDDADIKAVFCRGNKIIYHNNIAIDVF